MLTESSVTGQKQQYNLHGAKKASCSLVKQVKTTVPGIQSIISTLAEIVPLKSQTQFLCHVDGNNPSKFTKRIFPQNRKEFSSAVLAVWELNLYHHFSLLDMLTWFNWSITSLTQATITSSEPVENNPTEYHQTKYIIKKNGA